MSWEIPGHPRILRTGTLPGAAKRDVLGFPGTSQDMYDWNFARCGQAGCPGISRDIPGFLGLGLCSVRLSRMSWDLPGHPRILKTPGAAKRDILGTPGTLRLGLRPLQPSGMSWEIPGHPRIRRTCHGCPSGMSWEIPGHPRILKTGTSPGAAKRNVPGSPRTSGRSRDIPGYLRLGLHPVQPSGMSWDLPGHPRIRRTCHGCPRTRTREHAGKSYVPRTIP